MEITKEMLIANETVLVTKKSDKYKCLYLGCVPNLNVHFTSEYEDYNAVGLTITIEEINENYIIKQPESKIVPLERKVYDFVPVRVRDSEDESWGNAKLIACLYGLNHPYFVILEDFPSQYKYCEFI